MARDPDLPAWKGQRPWFEIWFAVILDESRRRALWLRQTFFVPPTGDGRATIWGAWFDADAPEPAKAAKRYGKIDDVKLGEGDELIRLFDAAISRTAAVGSVEGLAWDVKWSGGRESHADVPTWLPTPSHAEPVIFDGEASGSVVVGGTPIDIKGRATAMHLWGKRRVPTLQWIWAPWLGDTGLEVQAASLRDTFSLGISTLRLDGPNHKERGRPATAAFPSCLVDARIGGARKIIHARAWAEPAQTVGFAYRDTDGRDVMVAQSDIGSAACEIFTRSGIHWKMVEELRSPGGVAVEIHQHAPLPDVDYIAWDATSRSKREVPPVIAGNEEIEWPEVTAIVALGLTYGDHVRETGQKLDPSAPPVSFEKHVRAFAPGDRGVEFRTVPTCSRRSTRSSPASPRRCARSCRSCPR